ncbi:hypothetical protein AMK59_6472, partial [Oryctes borbonicus]
MPVNVNMFVIFAALCLLYLDGVSMETSGENYCKDQKIQGHIDMKQLTGMWFAVETVTHLQDSTTTSAYYEEPTTIESDTCAVITISDRPNLPLAPMYKNFQKYNQSYGPGYTSYETEEPYSSDSSTPHPYRYRQKDHWHRQYLLNKQYQQRKDLSITWDEFHTTTVYAAYYTYPVGVWYIYEPTTDEYNASAMSSHLVGNIQVLKAVGNHVVLTFCIRWPEEKLFSALLSRSPKLSKEDRSGVHNLLRRLQLDFV